MFSFVDQNVYVRRLNPMYSKREDIQVYGITVERNVTNQRAPSTVLYCTVLKYKEHVPPAKKKNKDKARRSKTHIEFGR